MTLNNIIKLIIVGLVLYIVHIVLATIVSGTIIVIFDVILILLFILYLCATFGIGL